ncbi:hypothetical protein K440DRAFT_4777 [Wilcoxina mikolae CBS 423.85]|nr:hypothetical protein K440DRAFT_4777 [Wilcoxina mikolae CBS 423.85]
MLWRGTSGVQMLLLLQAEYASLSTKEQRSDPRNIHGSGRGSCTQVGRVCHAWGCWSKHAHRAQRQKQTHIVRTDCASGGETLVNMASLIRELNKR